MSIGIAVVGAGYWGPNLIRNFAGIEACHLAAVCDRSGERLESLRRSYGDVRLTEDFESLLADDDIAGVAVATPVETHHALCRRILEAGKSVFVEKPLARSVAECRELDDFLEKPLDVLYDLYDERIDVYEADPPGEDWDGVFVATSK